MHNNLFVIKKQSLITNLLMLNIYTLHILPIAVEGHLKMNY